ncbi:MAG: DoxX family protein [Deltaproteobacteria bacterium]|nr:DoxX family protein [Deltaproteobacteria bacterium]
MNIALWIAQALLGLGILAIGLMKLTTPAEELAKAGTMATGLIRFIGAAEVAGGLGVILPAATRILPVLTPIAAFLLVVVMILAVGYHVVVEGQPSHSGGAVVFGLVAAFVAWGRALKAPIRPR